MAFSLSTKVVLKLLTEAILIPNSDPSSCSVRIPRSQNNILQTDFQICRLLPPLGRKGRVLIQSFTQFSMLLMVSCCNKVTAILLQDYHLRTPTQLKLLQHLHIVSGIFRKSVQQCKTTISLLSPQVHAQWQVEYTHTYVLSI